VAIADVRGDAGVDSEARHEMRKLPLSESIIGPDAGFRVKLAMRFSGSL
jgi:hypothetical protein